MEALKYLNGSTTTLFSSFQIIFVKILIWKTDVYVGKVAFYHTMITSAKFLKL